jgi:hypothetical protein
MSFTRIFTASLLLAMSFTSQVHAETPQSMMLELRIEAYTPEIDSAFESATPYADAFGTEFMWGFGGYIDYQLIKDYGSLAIGAGISYKSITGQAAEADSDDETQLHMVPLTLGLTYRFDMLAQRWAIPIVPYFKAGLTCAIWWVTNGKGDIANTRNPVSPYEERTGWSDTWGFNFGGGVQFLLDIFSDRMAATMDNEMGVNGSYLFVEYMRHSLNDFGSPDSMELSSDGLSFGLMFEF